MDTEKTFKIIKEMLLSINISIEFIHQLEGISIERDVLLNNNIITFFQSKQTEIKECGYSSSKLTSLHTNNTSKQQYPGINMLRQLLKCNGYKLKPYVKSMGYDYSTGKKIVYRYFIIVKLTNDEQLNNNSIDCNSDSHSDCDD